MGYLPIEDYGLIGNMQTAALVGITGSIDWLCLPHFDSPSVFAAILDDAKGGRFSVSPRECTGLTARQVYWPDTNILITRFLLDEGVVEVTDYMPVGPTRGQPGYRQLVRRVEAIRGMVPVQVNCQPRFNYARDGHRAHIIERGAVFQSTSLTLQLMTSAPLELTGPDDAPGVKSDLSLRQGERMTFVLRVLDSNHASAPVLSDELEQELFGATVLFWHQWIAQSTYVGRWREMVTRSALLLKLLTFEPTGALVAAPTCSLPESIPGLRNWDYRYTWIRDSSFSLYALLRLGFTDEAAAFMGWLEKRCQERRVNIQGKPPSATGGLQIMYGVHGETSIPEQTLDHLEGYRGCRPVRIGNGAASQLQLDVYGELMDSVYLHSKYNARTSWDMWENLLELLEWLCDHWQTPDEGIWETRGGPQHFLYSKVMCWVALDRGLRVAGHQSLPANMGRWITLPRRDLPRHHAQRLVGPAAGLCPALRRQYARCVVAGDAPGPVHRTQRPAHDQHARCHLPRSGRWRPALQQPGLPL